MNQRKFNMILSLAKAGAKIPTLISLVMDLSEKAQTDAAPWLSKLYSELTLMELYRER